MQMQRPIQGEPLPEGLLAEQMEQAQREEEPVSGLLFTGQDAPVFCESLEFQGCQFENCRLSGGAWDHVEFTDCTFTHCDLSNAQWSHASFHRVELISCKLMGTQLREACMRHTQFTQCRANYLDCGGADLKLVAFADCSLTGATFSECRLGAAFIRCRLEEAGLSQAKLHIYKPVASFTDCHMLQVNLFHTPLRGVDFTTCAIDGLVVAPEDLAGAVVTVEQAAGLARLLGLVIR